MQRILRFLLPLAVLLALAGGLVACGGGGGGDKVSASTDVNSILDKTFSGKKSVKSGKIDLHLNLNVTGGGSGLSGPVDVRLTGPFESQGKNKLPKFDISLAASGQGQDIKAGAENTGSKAFVTFKGQAYSVTGQVYDQLKQGFEQAAAKSAKQNNGKQPSLSSLGINPKDWLTNAKNQGDAKVGDTDVVKITGGVDVSKFLDDINTALAKAGSLGLQNQQLPTRLTDQQKQQVEKAIKDVSVEIDTGKDDSILRRMLINLTAADPNGSGKANVTFDLQLLDVNQGQDFSEPSGAKPIDQLLQQFGGAGGLSGLLGGSASAGGSSSSSSSSSGGGASQEKLKKYSDCVTAAGNDVSKAQKCAELLK